MPLDPLADAQGTIARGLEQLDADDPHGAMLTFGLVLEADQLPERTRASALRHRGRAKERLGDLTGAIADFSAVVEMPNSPPGIKEESFGHRARMRQLLGQYAESARDLIDLGRMNFDVGNSEKAIELYTAVMEMSEAPPALIEEALYCRYQAREQTSDRGGTFSDFRAWQQMKAKSADDLNRA